MKTTKRTVIMQAAEQLFSHRRIHEITLDEVARLAGVGKGTIYHHFKDKDDLFFQVATSGFDELCELVHTNVPADLPFHQQLLQMSAAISRFFEDRHTMFQIMIAEDIRMPRCKRSLRERWFTKRHKLILAVTEILQRGVDAGLVRGDIPAETMAHYLLGMLRTRNHDLQLLTKMNNPIDLPITLFCTGILQPANAIERRKV